jgi:hypothetical protein
VRHNDGIAETTGGAYLYDRIMNFRSRQEEQEMLAAAEKADAERRRREREAARRAAIADRASRKNWHVIKAVVCVETGERYPSIKAAAEAVGRYRTALANALREGGRCAGFHWRYATQAQQEAA